ncbi:hypothetical protein H0H92_014442 [Tricholoma furcatifolium]|nr:hypothetical protein H0H92_014442 [Tricholoma furcatifolium]
MSTLVAISVRKAKGHQTYGRMRRRVQQKGEELYSTLLEWVSHQAVPPVFRTEVRSAGYAPSKIQLLGLDLLIIILQCILATIAYETAIYERSSDTNTLDMLLPIPISPSTSSELFTPMPSSPSLPTTLPTSMEQHTKSHPPLTTSPYVVDLRFAPIVARLRNPPPTQSVNSDASLPLPNTTPWPLPSGMRMMMRASAQIRVEDTRVDGTRVPGGLNSREG